MTAIRPAHSRTAPLTELVAGLGLSGPVDSPVRIDDITLDSRDVRQGTLWVALPGNTTHGAAHAPAALGAGAAAILTDAGGAALMSAVAVPVLVSRSLRHDMGIVASRVFGYPAEQLVSLGVTGTNGKSTTVALLEAALTAAGRTVGTIGTIGFRLAGQELPSERSTVTTPESPDLQALIAVMVERGADAVALEVSSHAMALERATGMVLDVAGFLNLGRDHLDFHGDMESYFEAKAALFSPEHTRAAVCWVDDPSGQRIAERARRAGLRVVTVGTKAGVDFRMSGWEPVVPLGGRAVVHHGSSTLDVTIAMPGLHNMVDATLALAMADAVGVPIPDALEGLHDAQVPGRMQVLELQHGAPTVVVDFAHTPQAVAASLDALSESFERIITVLGCGGDRDVEKRPLMGRAAAERSNLLVVTDDNPRTEDPASIRRAMLEGACATDGSVVEVPGRRAAIQHALANATAGSVVAILGKGHERGQQIGRDVLDFDDAVEARRAWGRNVEGHS